MASVTKSRRGTDGAAWDRIEPVTEALSDPSIPLLHEDDGYEEMGDADIHTRTLNLLFNGLLFHFSDQSRYRIFVNLNLYYSKTDPTAYVSPDLMVIASGKPLSDALRSYRIGQDGPAPVFVAEVLSERTFQQRDLTDKPLIYAGMRVLEYALFDVPGQYLSVRLLLKKLLPGGGWLDTRDADGGFTSDLGFRTIIEDDGQIRLLDAVSGKSYPRPTEAKATADALQDAEERLRTLQAKFDRLRGARKRKKQ